MSRIVSVCLCAVMAFVAVTGVSLLRPVPALAASGTVVMETPLHESPDPASPLIALLPEGTVVSIDGPPVDGFYPVTAGEITGWMRGETLELAKDIVEPPAEEAATPPVGGETMPLEQEASDAAVPPADAADPPAEPAVTGTDAVDPATTAPVETGAASDAPVEAAPPDAAPVDPATQPTNPTDAALADAPPADPAMTADIPAEVTSDPAADAAAPELATDETVATAPAPDPNAAAIPVAESGPSGPASAASELPILLGPGPEYGVITTVPAGSAVEQTGHVIDGYVSVQVADVTGWAALDRLAPPGSVATAPPAETPVVANLETPVPDEASTLDAETRKAKETPAPTPEAAPSPTPEVTPTPTPEPPLGPAGVLDNMPILDGPGPEYGLIFTVPAGSTVEQTGELVNGFVSVRYKEVVGWAARELLGEPFDFAEDAPEETAEPVDTKTPKPGSGVAYTTVDLSLRQGPSANEEPIVTVPAGSRVVLTGVMEGDFQRVTFQDQVGWIANEYLATPENPEPNSERTNKKQHYTEREIIKIIHQAADRYNQSPDDMVRVARCESNLDPYAVNPSGSYGLFQFIRSTWKSTPYGDEDIFDPKANANAAAWMWSEGRKSEWVCQ